MTFLSSETIENYYKTNFTLMQFYNWSLSELESMYPFERTIYIALLKKYQIDKEQQS